MVKGLVLHPQDDVAVVVEPVAAGERVQLSTGGEIVAVNDIPFAHKIAIRVLTTGMPVRKYGEVIGETTKGIAVGEHVHVHNIRSLWHRR